MSVNREEARKVLAEADLLHSAEAVHAALDRVAGEITTALSDCQPIFVCVLNGGIIPAGHLATRLDFPMQMDYLHASRYRGATSGGELHWIARPSIDMRDRTVLVVDDILDEGYTLAAILKFCREAGAREVQSAVLVEKEHDRRPGDLHATYTGLTVADRYVFGFGMDYKGYFRNLPGIYAVHGH